MVTKTIKKAKDKKNDAKNRTYEKMAEYISLQDNAEGAEEGVQRRRRNSLSFRKALTVLS